MEFTSARERFFWTIGAVLVAGIYATLGLARVLAEELRNREMIDSVFVAGFVGLLVAGLVLAVRTRPGIAEVAVVMAAGAAFLMLASRLALPEERTHLFEYAAVAIIAFEALTERAHHTTVARPALTAIGIALLVGTVDELIQLVIPFRVFDPIDLMFNALAAVLSVAAVVAVRTIRSRR